MASSGEAVLLAVRGSNAENHENEINQKTITDIYRKKYALLKRKCERIQLDNEKCLNRLYYVKKAVRKMSRERRFLMNKLNKHGDDYKNATLPLPVEDDSMLHLMSISNSVPPTFPASRGLAGLVSKSQRVKNPVGRPRAGRPRLISEMTSRDDRSQPSGRGSRRKRMAAQNRHEKEKDPLAPKKPANAFMMFCQTKRQTMQESSASKDQEKGSEVTHQELTRRLAKKWNYLDAEDKETYYSMYEQDKDRYHKEMKEYIKSSNPESLKVTNPASQPLTNIVLHADANYSVLPKIEPSAKSESQPTSTKCVLSTSEPSTATNTATSTVTNLESIIFGKTDIKLECQTHESGTQKLGSSLQEKSAVGGDDPYHFDDD